ncbi:LysR substrate-binding domain-containing protein [Chromohalobacter sp. 48-RD10]|uniref:LysR substrate-binding domain-containing protein n=1 Tax=Chromohalobacter sp. 48-RD10 TaxID=2994063 RepID=UPI0024688687|nr:LysR substrate-binding domain-containing protein [Chromohalobacter sp. 48-RD10]
MLNPSTWRTLDIDLLRTFHLACALGTLRAVAERRHFTLGAVSQQIKRLEQQLEQQLLQRSRAGVTLTAAGEQLRAQSTSLLVEHDQLMDRLLKQSTAGVVRLGLPEVYTPRLLNDILPTLAASHPRLQLQVQTSNSGELERLVDQGVLDLAIVVTPQPNESSMTRLWQTRPVWAGSASTASVANDPLPLALHPNDCPYRAIGLKTLQTAGRNWNTVFASASVAAIESAVDAGIAISVLDRARLTPGIRELGTRDGLPSLPDCHACLMHAPTANDIDSSAIDVVARQLQSIDFMPGRRSHQ